MSFECRERFDIDGVISILNKFAHFLTTSKSNPQLRTCCLQKLRARTFQ